MRVLDERTCIAVEVDRFAGVEQHRFLGIDLQDEILEGSQPDHRCDGVGFLRGTAVQFAQFVRHLAGGRYHVGDQIVCIDDRSLAGFHLAFGQFDHAVGKVVDVVAPFVVSQLLEDQLEHLEMVVLFVAHYVDHFVQPVLLEAAERRAEILRHIDRCAVAAQQ